MEEGTSDTNCMEATPIDPQSIAMFNVPMSEAALPPPPLLLGGHGNDMAVKVTGFLTIFYLFGYVIFDFL